MSVLSKERHFYWHLSLSLNFKYRIIKTQLFGILDFHIWSCGLKRHLVWSAHNQVQEKKNPAKHTNHSPTCQVLQRGAHEITFPRLLPACVSGLSIRAFWHSGRLRHTEIPHHPFFSPLMLAGDLREKIWRMCWLQNLVFRTHWSWMRRAAGGSAWQFDSLW